MSTVKELDLTPVGRYANGEPYYSFHTSFPSRNVRALDGVYSTPEIAYREAQAVVRRYEMADQYGNMGEVLGVVRDPNGWRGVINTYHSNT